MIFHKTVDEQRNDLFDLTLGFLIFRNIICYTLIYSNDSKQKILLAEKILQCQKIIIELKIVLETLVSPSKSNKFSESLLFIILSKEVMNFNVNNSINYSASILNHFYTNKFSTCNSKWFYHSNQILDKVFLFILAFTNTSNNHGISVFTEFSIKPATIEEWYEKIKWRKLTQMPGRESSLITMQPEKYTYDKNDINSIIHNRIYNLEIPATEIYAMILVSFPFKFDGFDFSMAKQIADEGRHADMLLTFLEMANYSIYDKQIHLGIWERVTIGENAAECLASQAVIGEGYTLGNDLALRDLCIENKQLELANLFEIIYIDEIQHVREGIYWYNKLTGKKHDELLKLLEQDFPPLTPRQLDISARQFVGFTQKQIERQILIGAKKIMR